MQHIELSGLNIGGIHIRQDAQGRYCLNDLHKAAGGEKRHQPSNWLQLQQTIELVSEFIVPGIPGTEQIQPLKTYQGGSGLQGTFVVWELVYAYAMWISPSFHIKVIRAYHALVTQSQSVVIPDFTNLIAIARTIANSATALAAATKDLVSECERCTAPVATTTQPLIAPQAQLKPLPVKPTTLREATFVAAWSSSLGSQSVTASDLYLAIAACQCQILTDAACALFGDVTHWTPRKLAAALNRWSKQPLDGYLVQNVGKTSSGNLWQVE